MNFENILLEKKNSIAYVTVNRPKVLNALNMATMEELRAIVDEAHRERHKVASHAMALNGVHNSVEAGVDTIEHGNYIADEDLKTMAARGILRADNFCGGICGPGTGSGGCSGVAADDSNS